MIDKITSRAQITGVNSKQKGKSCALKTSRNLKLYSLFTEDFEFSRKEYKS